MNLLTDSRQVTAYLHDIGWLTADESADVELFPGGISGRVWRIESTHGSWVLKQPLQRLATREEWVSDMRRLDVEVEALKQVSAWFPEVVPVVLHHDATNHVCLMSCAPGNAVSWKAQMMEGRFDPTTATAVGHLLRDIHSESARREASVRPKFEDLEFFDQLRIEPFHRFLIDRYAELEGPINSLISELIDHRTTLVHGDFSPKNMLVRPSGELILLDFEVAHWGNPVFDVAYCAGHLMLKGWAVGPGPKALACIEAYLNSYGGSSDQLLPHLGLMLLARLDGKSTVDYVEDPALRTRIRDVSIDWIRGEDGGRGTHGPLDSIKNALIQK